MLKIENVTKQYGKLVANDNISFRVEPGQIALLLGPNGAGKSTIIKCIVGLLRFSGQILVNGKDNKSIEAKKRMGYVPEMPAVYDLLTIEEHMEFIRRAYRLADDGYDRVLLERFELWDKRTKLGKELSKGMQQKLSICCALLHKPEVIVFDEPMVGLDPHAIKELKQMFKELRAGGAAILVSTHMLGSVDDEWDVAHIMVNGSFAASIHSRDGAESGEDNRLERLFFQITEGDREASGNEGDGE